jgi:uncharacterized damage-inducible protein DinB
VTSQIQDLFGHQVWADAELWRALEAHPAARDDRAIRERLHHIHQVQRAFMWAVGDRAAGFARTRAEEYGTFALLKRFARETHGIIDGTLSTIGDARLADTISMPWFKDPPLTLTVSEALTQCAMHSQWHRGQNATRLRELGAVPPTVDLIVWFWKGRPAPVWD